MKKNIYATRYKVFIKPLVLKARSNIRKIKYIINALTNFHINFVSVCI